MSVTYAEQVNQTSGHEVLHTNSIVICYANARRFGKAVRSDSRHVCPFCKEQVFTFAS